MDIPLFRNKQSRNRRLVLIKRSSFICQWCCMGAQLGLSLWGRNTCWGLL